MGRLSYILLGGDPANPDLKRYLLRILLYTVLLLAAGKLLRHAYEGPYVAAMLFGLRSVFLALVAFESVRYYRRCDELLQHLTVRALALSLAILIGAGVLYHGAVVYLGLPAPTLTQSVLATAIVVLGSWVAIVPKSL